MGTWWFADSGKKTGPLEPEELKRLLETGKINSKTLVWKEGMAVWQSLDEVSELSGLKAALPPPVPKPPEPDPLSYPLAARWPRFFARIFDLWWETLLIGTVSGAILGRYSVGFVEWINRPGTAQLFGLICVPIAMILDAVIYQSFGNTPGKALLRLKVGSLRGESLSFSQYLGRNFSVWAIGLAFGLPLVNLFTLAYQSRRLGKGQQASYDETTGFRIRAGKSGFVAKSIFGIAFVTLFGVMAALNSIEKESALQSIKVRATPNYSWVNPITQISANINSNWKNSTQANKDGLHFYLFSELTNHAAVVLGVEPAPSISLDEYVRAFEKNNASELRFSDGGQFFELDGLPHWKGSGSMINFPSTRVNIQIIQIGSNFWRVGATQAMPYEYSDALVAELTSALWNTVK